MEQVLSITAIREQKAALIRVINDAQRQMSDLDVAERIVRRFGHDPSVGDERKTARDLVERALDEGSTEQAVMGDVVEAVIVRALPTRALFMSILRQSENPWMTANEIQERASAIKGQEVPMATVSPTLSNMKNVGVIRREGLKVALTERLNENEAPNGGAAGASETAQAAQ